MRIERIFDLRFLVPPSLFLSVLWLLSPYEFANLKLDLLLGAGILLGLGFALSTCVDVLVRKFFLTESYYSKEEKCILATRHPYWDADIQHKWTLELISWMVLDESASEHIKEQIHKRWQMGNAALSSAAGICSGVLTARFMSTQEFCYWISQSWYPLITISLVLSASMISGIRNLHSVKKMDQLLLKRLSNTIAKASSK